MEIYEQAEKRIVEIWMTNADRQDKQLCDSVKQACARWKQQGLLPIIYFSGEKDLYEQTFALLERNKKHPRTR